MILVSASALGLASARWWYNLPGHVSQSSLDVQSVSEMVAWLLLPMSPALIAIRLRQPRPPWRRLVRQPGFQANLVVCLAAITETLGGWGYTPEWHPPSPLGIAISPMAPSAPWLGSPAHVLDSGRMPSSRGEYASSRDFPDER